MENDTISRKVAIALADKLKDNLSDDERIADAVMAHNEGILKYQTALSLLPSAQPEVLACGEGELSAQPEDICSECDAWNVYKNYAQPQRTGRWSGLWSEPQDDNSIYGEKLMEGDTIYLLGVEGVVKQEYGAWGWASVEYVPWEKLEEKMPHGNKPNFCYCDNFVSFWELKWAFDDGSDWDGVPFIRHGADMRGEQDG